jgi:hypothetical protein
MWGTDVRSKTAYTNIFLIKFHLNFKKWIPLESHNLGPLPRIKKKAMLNGGGGGDITKGKG